MEDTILTGVLVMGIFWTIAFWLFFCALVGAIAKKDGRDFWAWFAISIFVSPLLGGMALLIAHLVKDDNKEEKKEE